ncbi:hypothetical protein OOK58_52720 [Streptomyces sp. NBC_01728]|uniref:hypothetical protein n=1 Tax=unclassified Streptomyces TaxID=2593676 RepID=UPI002257869F|nr:MULTISPECIES: hypothetical protein [unclassified Streptomyces]MCX4460898.1 hypothetical protein [Streptomyces sp. NBC_01719]MCX4499772.1 hypothetical protein [Streptomyces sp. NBC_01728]MCX4597688.1 hypothetical protein [Streptomyces sp. NBC_01549]
MQRSGPVSPAGDRHWRGSARLAVGCALAFGTLSALVDWDAGTLTAPRAALWSALSVAVFAVLLPQRVTAGQGWLMARGTLRRRAVRTDALVSVRQYDGVSAQLVLRDAYGHRLELDSRVLSANPFLWHELDTGVRRSLEKGTLLQGEDVLRRLAEQIDGETAQAVLRASGLS